MPADPIRGIELADTTHKMGMLVVAEGVERPEQMALLQSLDCDLVQGYLFSKPLSAEGAERFIEAYGNLAKAS